jgi:hypothetical protein
MVLLLFLLVVISGLIALGFGIVGVIHLIAALIGGRTTRACIRPLVAAAAIFLVPYCSFKLATWHPELGEWRLKGLTDSEVIKQLGTPHHVARWRPGGVGPVVVHLIYYRSLWMYSIELDRDDCVVRVDRGLIPDL